VPAKASVGSLTLGSTEQKIDLGSLAFTDNWRLTSASTPAIDKGVTVDMTTNNSVATTAVDPTIFANVFNQDIDKHQVPCGAGVDIGASEYCDGAGGSTGVGGATGTGRAAGAGGAVGSGGTQGPAARTAPAARRARAAPPTARRIPARASARRVARAAWAPATAHRPRLPRHSCWAFSLS
jgi:hypothetical protein